MTAANNNDGSKGFLCGKNIICYYLGPRYIKKIN